MSDSVVKEMSDMLRQMKWQEVKGSLFAILATYNRDVEELKYITANSAVKQFVEKIDGLGLFE